MRKVENFTGKILSNPGTLLRPIYIEASNLPDAWFQCVYNILDPEKSRSYVIDKGSYEGETRYQFDFVTIHIFNPGYRPLIPDIPKHLDIPPPVESIEYVERYFLDYIIGTKLNKNETYTYGSRLNTSIQKVIDRYKKYGPGNNQLILQIGRPADINLTDPCCCRHIDTLVIDGKLHFFPYFRSWELWSGLPTNLAAFQMLKELMAQEIGVEDGEMICTSKGLHIYKYVEVLAEMRTNLKRNKETSEITLKTVGKKLNK